MVIERRLSVSSGDRQPLGWCRAERLRLGIDILIEEAPDYTLARCIGEFSAKNIHAGKWILWDGPGKCIAIGSEEWVKSQIPEGSSV